MFLIGSNLPNISLGNELDATGTRNGGVTESPIIFLDSNTAILCFMKDLGSGDRAHMVELALTGTTLSIPASPELFDIYGETITHAAALSSTELLVAYSDVAGGNHVVKYTIASYTPTYDWAASFGGSADVEKTYLGLFNSTYALAYYNYDPTDLNCRVVTIADGTLGSAAGISGGGDVMAPPVMFDDTYALLIFMQSGALKATIATRSGTSLAYDTAQSISTDVGNDSKWVWTERVNSTKARIYYRKSVTDNDIYVMTATNTAGILTLSSESKLRAVTSTSSNPIAAAVKAVNMGQYNSLLAYIDYDDSNYVKVSASIEASEYSPQTVKSTASNLFYIDKLDNNTAIISYSDSGANKPIYARVIKLS